MREFVKGGGPERIAAQLGSEELAVFKGVVEKILNSAGDFAERLQRAAKSGSRIEAAKRLKNLTTAPL
jgi:hypothetical protein